MITYVVCPHFYAFNNFMQNFNFAKCYETKKKNQSLNNFISFIFAQKHTSKNRSVVTKFQKEYLNKNSIKNT